jgi:hypothetical protein
MKRTGSRVHGGIKARESRKISRAFAMQKKPDAAGPPALMEARQETPVRKKRGWIKCSEK